MRRRKWREGKVCPIPGSSPHDRLVSRVISSSLKESLRRSLPRHCFPHLQTILGAQYAFLRHVGIYLVRCGFKIKTKNQTPGWGRAASRWSAPSPGSRTCREDHAPSHRPQMSSGRLFLDRVARQHGPSPLHRHAQTTTPSRPARQKPDISTLQGIGHFYFALTASILQQVFAENIAENYSRVTFMPIERELDMEILLSINSETETSTVWPPPGRSAGARAGRSAATRRSCLST